MRKDAPSPGDRRATLLLRLGADGKVDLEVTAGLRTALPGPLLEEAMRAALGRMSCTASELQAQGGPDAEAIRRIVRLEGARPRAACHLCKGGPGSCVRGDPRAIIFQSASRYGIESVSTHHPASAHAPALNNTSCLVLKIF